MPIKASPRLLSNLCLQAEVQAGRARAQAKRARADAEGAQEEEDRSGSRPDRRHRALPRGPVVERPEAVGVGVETAASPSVLQMPPMQESVRLYMDAATGALVSNMR